MLIENPEALKHWLENFLIPLCDADPQVLAKYCLALVRKDRDESELKASMLEQLDVFLKSNTKPFVDKFLVVAKNKSYLLKEADVQPSSKPATPPAMVKGHSPDSTSPSDNPVAAPPEGVVAPIPPLPPIAPVTVLPHPPPDSPPPPPKKDDTLRRKDSDKEERRTRRRSRGDSRSRSGGRSGRSKYDDRRRRSPPNKRYRRSKSRSRSRSPREAPAVKDKQATPPSTKPRPNRSRSPLDRKATSKSPPKDETSEKKPEATDAVVSSVISVPPPTHAGLYASGKSQRCRDYDEKGFCMRGDLCPYDHGSDPVVFDGGALDFPPPTAGAPAPPLSQYSVPPPSNPSQNNRTVMARIPPLSRLDPFGEYTPNNPSLWADNTVAAPGAPRFSVPPPGMSRELINVTVGDQSKNALRSSLAKRLGPTNKFSSFGHNPSRFVGSDNCTLELRKIPQDLNNISLINDHFTKFGNVINIQINHEGDSEAALVAFSSHAEANAAYRSAEAVFNNRFIKLFWHNAGKENPQGQQRPVHDRLTTRVHGMKPYAAGPRAHDMYHGKEKVMHSRGTLVKTVYNSANGVTDAKNGDVLDSNHATPDSTQQPLPPAGPSADEIRKLEIETICKQQELLKAELLSRQKVENKKMEALKLQQELEQRTRQLHERQMQQVKVLISKLETNKSTMKIEDIKSMMKTIKLLQASTASTKARIVSSGKTQIAIRNKIQLDKEIMDTELELYNAKPHENPEIHRLKDRLQELKVEMTHLKAIKMNLSNSRNVSAAAPPPMRGAMGGRGRGRGRATPTAVDRRSTCINASGFEREDKGQVLAHFSALGSVTTYSWDDQTPSINVHFSSRREAEKVMMDGRHMGDRLLTLTWSTTEAPALSRQNSITEIPQEDTEEITEEIVEIVETVDVDELFEDDDDEEETRSWRR